MFKFIRRVLLLVLILFTGYKLFHMYRDVKQVMTYQSLVREVLSEQDTPANEELVLAMIYTETKGKESDVMQSSESASGTTNTISDNRSSIRQGIQTLTENLYLAQEKGVDVWTAVQAYNFGPAYIDFIAQNIFERYSCTYFRKYNWKNLSLCQSNLHLSRWRTLCGWWKLLLL